MTRLDGSRASRPLVRVRCALLLAVLGAARIAPAAAAESGAASGAASSAASGAASSAASAAGAVPAPQYFPPLERSPLDPPLRLSASFGEYRSGHFHAGLDFSTGGTVGRPVYAALAGDVVRVRTSGAGYGRSLYVQAADGRLLVYAHLDAFEEPFASYAAAAQDSSGAYEQDLWPAVPAAPGPAGAPRDPAPFRVRAGQRLGWSGRSGTDAPHLHFEIRRGDVAYNPLLAGVTVEDTVAPRIRRVALEPIGSRRDPASSEEAQVIDCSGNDTALVAGMERLVVEAVDARGDGRFTMAPWRVRAAGEGLDVECRFDSVSWAEGMSEVDFVYDRGRVMPAGRHAVLLWAPAGFRPRVLLAHAALARPVGSLAASPDGRPLHLQILAEDAAGHAAAEMLVLGAAPSASPVPEPATGMWVAADSAVGGGVRGFRWSMAGGTLYEDRRVTLEDLGHPEAPEELRARSHAFALEPALTPLRRPVRVGLQTAGAHAGRDRTRGGNGAGPRQAVAVYRDAGEGWEWLGVAGGPRAGWIEADSRALGSFALFRDGAAPRVRVLAPRRLPPRGAYSRWALEAAVEEEGSGVDARVSGFVVDGRRVPTEWDAVAQRLRWRPLRPPASGRHDVVVIAADRAGNVRRRHAGFVLD